MLVKEFEQSSSQYRFNLFQLDWNTNSKEFFLPLKMGELSYTHFYLFSNSRDYIQKRDHIGLFFLFSDSQKMKTPSSIYFLGIAKKP